MVANLLCPLQPSLGRCTTGDAEQKLSTMASQEQGFALGNKKRGKPQLRQCEFWFIQCMAYLIPANRSLKQGFTPDHQLVPQFLHQEICAVLCSSSCFFAVVGCQKGLFLLQICSLQPGLLFTPFYKASASMAGYIQSTPYSSVLHKHCH